MLIPRQGLVQLQNATILTTLHSFSLFYIQTGYYQGSRITPNESSPSNLIGLKSFLSDTRCVILCSRGEKMKLQKRDCKIKAHIEPLGAELLAVSFDFGDSKLETLLENLAKVDNKHIIIGISIVNTNIFGRKQ